MKAIADDLGIHGEGILGFMNSDEGEDGHEDLACVENDTESVRVVVERKRKKA